MSARLDLRSRVMTLRQQFREKNGLRSPNIVRFTDIDEAELERLGESSLGTVLYAEVLRYGARGAFQSYLGMAVVWGAEETEVGIAFNRREEAMVKRVQRVREVAAEL